MFWLADKLGYTVRDMLSRMDSREITRWQAFHALPEIRQKLQQRQQTDTARSNELMTRIFKTKGRHDD